MTKSENSRLIAVGFSVFLVSMLLLNIFTEGDPKGDKWKGLLLPAAIIAAAAMWMTHSFVGKAQASQQKNVLFVPR